MSDHLPECWKHPNCSCEGSCRCRECLCEELRACEQRVFQEQIQGRQHDMVVAYQRGLDAAEAAVAETAVTLGIATDAPVIDHFVAAIRALKEKP